MVTTRRSSTNASSFESGATGGIDLLERKVSAPVSEFVSAEAEETIEEQRARMRGNLDLLLNYDRYSEQVVETAPVVETSAQSNGAPSGGI